MIWPRSFRRRTGPTRRSGFRILFFIPAIVLLSLSASGASAQSSADDEGRSRTAPTQDPISHWKLDETSGTTAADSAGSNDGTLVNGPAWHPTGGWVDGALEFDGVDDYVDLGTMDVPAVAGMSIAFWFKADSLRYSDTRFISKASGSSGSDHYWMVSAYNSTALRFRLKTAGVTTTLISNAGEIEAGKWYHVAATYDGSKMRIYKNGVEIAIDDKTGTVDANPAVAAALGNQPGTHDKGFDGLLDDVRIYDRGLSPSEVAAMAATGVIESDDFHSTTLDTTRWRVEEPVGDVTFLMSGTNLVVGVPGGTKHNLSSSGILAPRLLQDAANTDFEIEAKFDSRGSKTYQGHGFVIHEDDDTFLSVGLILGSGDPRLYAIYVNNGSSTTKIDQSLALQPSYLRLTRSGDSWTYQYSYDGSNWTSAVTFTQALVVSEVGLFFSNTGAGGFWNTPLYVGNVDYFFNTAAPISPEDNGDPTAVTPPVVDVWYGDTQDFGQLGIPQHWANILGRVWDTDAIDTLYYSLNGGPTSPLTIGTDSPRLVDDGDYNIEIDYGDLNPGSNEVVITAIDALGERRDKTVVVNYTDGVTWALPYTAEFETAGSIMDEAHVVDGRWYVVNGEGVRVDSSGTGYDRLIVFGDTTWVTDYEVLVPMTIHQSSLGGPSGVGIGLGWKGNEGTYQPRLDAPYQAISWVKGFPDSTTLFLQGSGIKVSMNPDIQADVRYLMRTRSESLGNGLSRVSTKLWEDGTPEPPNWTLTNDLPTMDGSVILIAHRSIATFGDVTITPLSSLTHELTVNVVGSGTVVKSPDQTTYVDGDTVVVSAFPDQGWVFSGWSGGLTSVENPDTIIMTSDTTVTANFVAEEYTVTLSAVGNGTVTKTPDQPSYLYGDTVIVEAVPDSGWVFDSWSDGLVSSENPDTIVVTQNLDVTANFVQTLVLTANSVGNGVVETSPPGPGYAPGDTVVVTAVPDPGWFFDQWSGGLSGSENPDTIVMVSDTIVTATFLEENYVLVRGVIGGGSISASPNQPSYLYGDTVIVTAVPELGWEFDSWSDGLTGSENPDTLVMLSDTTVTATFVVGAYTLGINIEGAGAVSKSPDQETYAYGDTVVVSATPDLGWLFGGWSGALSGAENPHTLVMLSDTTLTASFAQQTYTFVTNVEGSGDVVLTPDQPTYVYGDTVLVTAVADPGWMFTGWSGGLKGTDNPDTVVVSSDTTATATFVQEEYVLVRSALGGGSVIASPNQLTYIYGDTVIVTAVADSGWVFDSWSGGLMGSENPDTVVMVSDTTITATFAPGSYVLTVITNGNGSVLKTPDQPAYTYGDTVIVEAVPDPGWVFDNWSGALNGSKNPDTLVMMNDTTVTATFVPANYALTLNTVGDGAVTKTPDQPTYAYGDTVIVTAVSGTGWVFDSWSDGISGSENPDTVVMVSDTTVTATFLAEEYTLTVSTVGNGSVTKTPDQVVYLYGDTVFVEAVPDTGWVFNSWSDGLSGSENPDTLIVVSDTTLTANFAAEQYTLTLSTVGNGSVTKTPDQPTYVYGDTVVVEAIADPGWVFDSWSGGLSGSENPDTLVVLGDTTVTATFLAEEYTLTVNTVGNGSVTKTPDQTSYAYGDTVLVQAVPDTGWVFDGWSGGLSGSENPDTLVMVGDTTVTATFVAEQYILTLNAVGNGSVTKTPDQPTYVYGDTVVVEAVPDPGWLFEFWSGGLSGSENPDTLVMVSDTTVTATFMFAQGPRSDDFHTTTLDTTIWRFEDVVGDATLYMSGTNAVVCVPGGTKHNLSSTGIFSPRLLQNVADDDFEVEVKFDSRGSRTYQGQGIIVQEDGDTYLRFDIIFESNEIRVYCGYSDAGSLTVKRNLPVPNSPPYLRVKRTGDLWEYRYSMNGTDWTTAVTFSQALFVTEMGVFCSNSGPQGFWDSPLFVGNVDYFFNTSAPIIPEDGGNPSVVTPPIVEAWYGDTQSFGQHGIPQQWVNILGRVWDTEQIDTLYYSLNGGPGNPLSLGPDTRRLVGVNDYNIEIDYADLNAGPNQVIITAMDTLGERRDTTVTVNFTDGVTWAMPYTADFETAGQISDVAHVVDGRWYLVDGEGVRVDSTGTGYDRLLVLGDYRWLTDYEVLLPMTIHQSSLHAAEGLLEGVGLGLGWQGHTGTEQPRVDAPYQAISWVKGFPDSATLFLQGSSIKVSMNPVVQANVRYLMRTRSQSLGNGWSRVRTKFWEDGTPEPPDWTLTNDLPTMDGSIILIAHRSIATFGDVTITALPPLGNQLTVNVVGMGSVLKAPDKPSYADGDTVIVTAVPDTGYVFDGWSGGLTGAENPDTIIMVSDTTITATFSTDPTGIRPMPIVRVLTVRQNWPNPFSRETYVEYGLPKSSDVRIEVFDVAGRRVLTEHLLGMPAGWNRFVFTGRDSRGAPLASGVYFYRIMTGDAVQTKKMVIVR